MFDSFINAAYLLLLTLSRCPSMNKHAHPLKSLQTTPDIF